MILNKMGYPDNLPCCMVFAPCSIGGIGLYNLKYKMEAQQLIILIWHMQAQTPLGQTFKVLVQTYQL